MLVNRLLVVHTWGIGDWLFFTPALQVLRTANPGIQVDVLVGTPSTTPIIRYYDGVNVLGVADVRRGGWKVLLLLLKNLTRRYDAAIFTAGIDSAKANLVSPFIRADVICALTTHAAHRPSFIHRFTPYDESRHRVDNNLALIRLLGVADFERPEPYLPLREIPQRRPGSVLVHPGCDALNSYKRWPIERFVDVCSHLLREGNEISVILGPAEIELKHHFQQFVPSPKFRLYADLSFTSAVKVIAAHDTLLHSDSGLGHIAAALGRKSIAIIGPANADATRPFGPKAKVIRIDKALPCQPCMRRGGRYGCVEKPCLYGVPVNSVMREILVRLDY